MSRTSEVIQSLRSSGDPTRAEASPALERVLPLTPGEVKAIPPGSDVCLSVYGVLSEDGLHVTRVEPQQESSEETPPTPEDVMG